MTNARRAFREDPASTLQFRCPIQCAAHAPGVLRDWPFGRFRATVWRRVNGRPLFNVFAAKELSMIQIKRLGMWVSVLALVVTFSTQAYAGPYNCRKDKVLDSPIQFGLTIQGERVRLTTYGGSDRSQVVVLYQWRILDQQNRQLDYFPKGILTFGVSYNMLRETNLEGLVPGTVYGIELISQDGCGNSGTSRQTVLIPGGNVENNPPVVSVPTIVYTGALGFVFPNIHFTASDDSGIREATVYVNGAPVKTYRYYDGVNFRWWTENYPADGVQSTLEGPFFTTTYPDAYRGQYALVEIEVVDSFGNTTTTSAWMGL